MRKPGMVRLNLDVTEALHAELNRLAGVSGCTRADVMRRRLSLIKIAIDAQVQGHTLAILDKDRKVIATITGY